MRRWLLCIVVLLAAAPAWAQIVPDREVEIIKNNFDNGQYKQVIERVRSDMAVANFSEKQRIDLLQYAALSAFNLGDLDSTKKFFMQLLQLNPDYVLDPFVVPPPAIKLFEQLKRDGADSLNLIRQQLALRAEQEKRAAAERERQRIEEEARRRRMEELAQDVTVRTVEKRSMLVNFLPFGLGQFQQGRTRWGIGFAATQAVLALASVVSYLALESMFENITYTWPDRLGTPVGEPFTVTLRRIPESKQAAANVWRTIKVVTGVGFYVAWGAGIADAVWHHQGEVVTEHTEPRSPDGNDKAPTPPAPKAGLYLSPGGGGLSVTFGF